MPLAFEQHLPGGMIEIAFQRWGRQPRDTSPEGTAEVACLSRPSGPYREIEPHPALKRRAIFRCPFGTRTKRGFLSGDLTQILAALGLETCATTLSTAPRVGPRSNKKGREIIPAQSNEELNRAD